MKKNLTMKLYCGCLTFSRKFRSVINSTVIYDELQHAIDFLKCVGNAVEIFDGENAIGYAEILEDKTHYISVTID